MDCKKVGELIYARRKEMGLTQKQLAELLGISDKAVSKWERAGGCPDISLLPELSDIMKINIEKIIKGSLDEKETDGGNMKNIKFYVCPNCLNMITSTSEAEISCCGRKLVPFTAADCDEKHAPKICTIEGDYYVTFEHEMTKQHFISFAAYVTFDRVLTVKLYPEQASAVRFPNMGHGMLYFFCNTHGLFSAKL